MSDFAQLTKSEKWLCVISATICLYYAATFLLLVLGNFWPGPLFDYWVDIPLLEKQFTQQLTLADLVAAHNNAHRILIPRLLFILDYRYFSGTNTLLITVSLLCKISTILLFNLILKNETLRTKLLLNALVFAGVLNAGNVYNVIFNFDIQWDLVSVFGCYAIYFYTKTIQTPPRRRDRILAYLFLCLAFFTHAGSLSLPPVFLLISLFNKKAAETVANIALMVLVFYIHSHLPFADPQNPDTQSALAALIMYPAAVALFVAKCISGALAFYLGTPGYYFSVYIFLLLVAVIVLSIKNRHFNKDNCNNVFLYCSLFLFLMISTIAAARAMFTPNVWAASRFQTTVLLFILCLHIHAWLLLSGFLETRKKIILQAVMVLHGLVIYGLLQYFTYNIPGKLSNAVFFSHAYMLTHGRNHHNAPRLLLWVHDEDVIANSDPFFRKNGFAWYANKQRSAESGYDFVDAGKPLVAPEHIPAFRQSCKKQIPALAYRQTAEGGIEFSAPLRHHLARNTWYAIDARGVVAGFAYIFISEDGFIKKRSLEGYAINENIAFFSEINEDHQPTCLYAVAQ